MRREQVRHAYALRFSRVPLWPDLGHNLVPRVSHLTDPGGRGLSALAPGGDKMRDRGNEVGGGTGKREEYLLIYHGLFPSSPFYAC